MAGMQEVRESRYGHVPVDGNATPALVCQKVVSVLSQIRENGAETGRRISRLEEKEKAVGDYLSEHPSDFQES